MVSELTHSAYNTRLVATMDLLSLQSNSNPYTKSIFRFPLPWQTIIHSALLFSWTCYLFAKWRLCVNSRSSQTWILAFLELLLAVPDLFAILEFTILFMSTPRSPGNDLRSTTSTIAPDATVHVLITWVCHRRCNDITFTDQPKQDMR